MLLLAGDPVGDRSKKAPTLRQVYAQAVLVCKSIAQQLFPGQDAVNRHIMCTDPLKNYADISPAPRRIVGVSACVDDANIIPQRNMTIYEPADSPGPPGRSRHSSVSSAGTMAV